jgi:hypothetical protein
MKTKKDNTRRDGVRSIDCSGIPKWLLQQEGITVRQWKARKRAQIKAVLKCFDDYRMGCAYTPDGEGEVGQIDKALASIRAKLSVKNWGR